MDSTDDKVDGIAEEVMVSWSPVLVPLLFSFIQGVVFLLFFVWKRGKDSKALTYELFEPRQFTKAHRSPAPFDGGSGMFGWAKAAYSVSHEELLKNVGLDSYMYLRFLRLGARLTLFGTVMSIILLPVYATGEARGDSTELFNKFTLARVGMSSNRLWASVLCWLNFVAFALTEMYEEWRLYSKHRYQFLAQGDVDTPPDFKYAVRVENIPQDYRSAYKLKEYFSKIFPGKVRQAAVCLNADKLDKMVVERQKNIVSLEKAVAFTHAKPEKPAPTAKKDAKMGGLCGGEKVEAIPYLEGEIERLNKEIDLERNALFAMATQDEEVKKDIEEGNPLRTERSPAATPTGDVEVTMSMVEDNTPVEQPRDEDFEEEEEVVEIIADGKPSATGFVTFTSLRAKQSAVQCELSGKKDRFDVFAAPEPSGMIWENVTTPLARQRIAELLLACFWMVGILFWAVPVSFVTGIANLNGIITSFGFEAADESAAWYGLVAGLLPVIFLQILMAVLFMAITMGASKLIKKKSNPEVDSYVLKWHQMFQFANLWLIIIGGSLFGQLDTLRNDQTAIFSVIADAMPGASVLLINMINVASFGAFGLELSLLPVYGVTLIMNLIQPEAQRTQRMLDDARKPPSLTWGKTIPKVVFIFLISVLYMPIVPIVQVFAFMYFGGSYLVMKHQCLHVYSTKFEGGGSVTWETMFSYLMVCMYMAEFVFIAFMGLKQGAIQSIFGFIPLVATIIMHRMLNRNIRKPLENLSLEVATAVDEEGELELDSSVRSYAEAIEGQLYGQPSLQQSKDERGPLPYRRDGGIEEIEEGGLN